MGSVGKKVAVILHGCEEPPPTLLPHPQTVSWICSQRFKRHLNGLDISGYVGRHLIAVMQTPDGWVLSFACPCETQDTAFSYVATAHRCL